MVPPLNALGVDVMTPGNWDFAYGPEVLQRRVSEMHFPVIACNVERTATNKAEFAPTMVREVGGVKIGLIGITSPIVSETMPKKFGAGLRFDDGQATLPDCINSLRHKEKVDLVVVISHLGFPQEVKLVEEIDGIDILLSGHTHNRLAKPARVGKTIIIQSGFDGSFLGVLELEIENRHVLGFKHRLIEISESIEPEPEVEKVVDEQLEPLRERMAEVVGQTATALNRMTVLESTMDNLVTDAYLSLTGAEVALSHGWRYGAPIPIGDVTVGDLWQIIPTNPEVFTVEMTGSELKEKLEANLESVYASDAFNQKGGYVIRVSGLNAIVRLNNPKGMRVEQLDIAGNPFDPDRRYKVAAAGEQDIQDIVEGDNRQNSGTRAIDVLLQYLKRYSPIGAELTHTKFVAV